MIPPLPLVSRKGKKKKSGRGLRLFSVASAEILEPVLSISQPRINSCKVTKGATRYKWPRVELRAVMAAYNKERPLRGFGHNAGPARFAPREFVVVGKRVISLNRVTR